LLNRPAPARRLAPGTRDLTYTVLEHTG
jgi:hypothetical protein